MNLIDFVGKLVYIHVQGQNIPIILETDGTNFGNPQIGFPKEAVKEIRVIEAAEDVNLVRAVIILGVNP